MGRQCTAKKLDGTPCQAWAVRGSDPPLCSAHGGAGGAGDDYQAGAHHVSACGTSEIRIDEIIADLAAKQKTLSQHIDTCLAKTDIKAIAHLLALHGQNASRLGRLLRDQRALSGDAADGIAGAIAQALDELSSELGVDL